ncbi:MAG: hypothetical protein GKR90_13335 [Pseudomonadales bacterium]|nr:hypothetical protein [Pseudomonadales bacterium]
MTISETAPDSPSKQESQDRLHRVDPVRSAPVRNHVPFRRRDNGEAARSTDQPTAAHQATPKAPADAQHEKAPQAENLDYGIALGYRVIDDQIAKAKNLASQWSRPKETAPSSDEWSNLANRMLNAYRDLGSVTIDAVEKLVRNAPHAAVPESNSQTNQMNHSSGAPSGAAVVVKLRTSQPVESIVSLPKDPGGELAVVALHGPVGSDPIQSVEFVREVGRGLTLQIDVPNTAGHGTYSGVIVEAQSNEPIGTLCLRIGV